MVHVNLSLHPHERGFGSTRTVNNNRRCEQVSGEGTNTQWKTQNEHVGERTLSLQFRELVDTISPLFYPWVENVPPLRKLQVLRHSTENSFSGNRNRVRKYENNKEKVKKRFHPASTYPLNVGRKGTRPLVLRGK